MKNKLKTIIKYLKIIDSKPSEVLPDELGEVERIDRFDDLISKSEKLSTFQKISPRKEFVEESKDRIFDQIMASQKTQAVRKRPQRERQSFARPLLASPAFSFILILILGFGFVGTAQAAESAAPGDFMYVVDITLENARLTLALNDPTRVHLRLEFASERLLEAQKKFDSGEISNGRLALLGFENNLLAVRAIILHAENEIRTELVQILANHYPNQIALLEEMLDSAAADVQGLVLSAMVAADHTYLEIAQLPQATVVNLVIITHLKFFTDDTENAKSSDVINQPEDALSPNSTPEDSRGDEYLPPGIIDNPTKVDDLPPGLIDKTPPPGQKDKDSKK